MNLEALSATFGSGGGLFLVVLLPLGAILLVLTLAFGGGSSRKLNTRINQVKLHHSQDAEIKTQVLDARRRAKTRFLPEVEELANRYIPRKAMLLQRIERAGLDISLGVYGSICMIIGCLVYALFTWGVGVHPLAGLMMGIFASLLFPHLWISIKISRRQKAFIANFPEAIDLIVRGIKAGLPVAESIKNAGDEIPGPIRVEFGRVTDAVRIGRKFNDALWDANRRLDVQEFKYFTIALSIQAETGGNLAETLDNLATVLRSRRQLKLKIKALSSEAKASAYIIGALPFVMAGLIYLVNPEYIMKLVTDPRGHYMIAGGLMMLGTGVAVMYKMVKFEV